jgi:hypothetical protein
MTAVDRKAGRFLAGLAVLALVGGCATGGASTSGPIASASASQTTVPTAGGPTPTPRPTPRVVVTRSVAYESSSPALVPGELDVYAPVSLGSWPVVVMFHGAPGNDPRLDRDELSTYAYRVADLGFVVFNASWGHEREASGAAPDYAASLAVESQAACAVEFARSKAAAYGGDPTTMIVFGHSGGAHAGAMVTFNRPSPSAGCLGGAALGDIEALITWEGNWLLSVNYPDWDGALAADARVMDVVTPWASLPRHTDQKVVMLVSERPGPDFERQVGDPWAKGSWLTVRDPSKKLRTLLEANGAFADGTLDFVEVQQLLYSVLKAQGNPVTLDTMPGSTHTSLSDEGFKVFLAAFVKAAAKD